MVISMAPLQGFTDAPFRNAIHRNIGGVDKFYTPFLRLENDGLLKPKYLKDILPENNSGIPVIPQILVNNSKDFLFFAKIIADNGYTEVNWNLGCPYPMVSKRKLGSGLIPYPEQIKQILETVIPQTYLKISIKIRAGYQQTDEIFPVLAAIETLPIHEIILHPRIARQMYKGTADHEIFILAQQQSVFKLAYNGDITTTTDFKLLQTQLTETNHFMIGRGLIANPFLGLEIKNSFSMSELEKRHLFYRFHQELLLHYEKVLSGESHQLNKMLGFWEYWSLLFACGRKLYKTLKKSHKINEYKRLSSGFIQNEAFIN